MENGDSFLAVRAEAASANEEWSRSELGDFYRVLDLGCAALDACSGVVAEYLLPQGNDASHSDQAVSLLAMLATSRAGTICSTLLQGYPVDAGDLLRGLLEIEAMQKHLASDTVSADRWMNNEELKTREYLRAVTQDDSTFAPNVG